MCRCAEMQMQVKIALGEVSPVIPPTILSIKEDKRPETEMKVLAAPSRKTDPGIWHSRLENVLMTTSA